MSNEDFDGSQVNSYEEVIPNGNGEGGYIVQYWTDSGIGWKELTRQDALVFVNTMSLNIDDEQIPAQKGGSIEFVSPRGKIKIIKS